MMNRTNWMNGANQNHLRSGGFTLIELLVGIFVAILATSAIMVSFSTFENRKRTATTGSDTQVNGAYALQMLEREIRMAGYGFSAGISTNAASLDTAMGCLLSGGFANYPPAPPPAPGAKQNSLNWPNNTALGNPLTHPMMAPILIANDANAVGLGGTDAIRVMYGDSAVVAAFEPEIVTQSTFRVNAKGLGINRGDTVLLYDSASRNCAIRRVTGISDFGGQTWTWGTPRALAGYMPPAADPRVTLAFDPALSTFNNLALSPNPLNVDTLFLLRNFRVITFSTIAASAENGAGRQFANVLYQYEGSTGRSEDEKNPPGPPTVNPFPAPPQPGQFELAPDVVNIQAQYGIDNTVDTKTIISQWRDATAANGLDPASLQAAVAAAVPPSGTVKSPLARIKAVRVALVARSPLLEQPRTAGTCSAPGADQNMGGAILRSTGLIEFNWPDGELARADVKPADVNNWACYRYQVFQTVIPLRSVIWGLVK